MQTGSGNDALPTGVAEPFQQVSEQVDLKLVPRSKVRVPALASERVITLAIPVRSGFSQSCAGGNHGGIAGGVRRAGVKRREVFLLQRQDPVSVCQEIVD